MADEFECGVRTSENRTDSDFFKKAGTDTGFVGPFSEIEVDPDSGKMNIMAVDTSGDLIAPNANMIIYRLKQPNNVFCPEGTANPIVVLPGYYSTGNTRTTRFSQSACPPGSYCKDGVVYDCPAGRYGIGSRLQSDACSGPCSAGHYCPRGSTSRNEYACPIGRYGAIEGLGSSLCSGPCKRALDCPAGSTTQYPPTNIIDSNIY
jgi:hypothetical protein